jgi:hypothetical protein
VETQRQDRLQPGSTAGPGSRLRSLPQHNPQHNPELKQQLLSGLAVIAQNL